MNANNKRYRPVGRPPRRGRCGAKNSPAAPDRHRRVHAAGDPAGHFPAARLLGARRRRARGRAGRHPHADRGNHAAAQRYARTGKRRNCRQAPRRRPPPRRKPRPGPTSETLGDDAYTQDEIVGARPTAMPGGYLPISPRRRPLKRSSPSPWTTAIRPKTCARLCNAPSTTAEN